MGGCRGSGGSSGRGWQVTTPVERLDFMYLTAEQIENAHNFGSSNSSAQVGSTPETPSGPQSSKLVQLAHSIGVALFHDPDGEGYASLPVGGHVETHRIRTKSFRTWLSRAFYEVESKPPGSGALQDAIDTLVGQAQFEGEQWPVHVRLSSLNGSLYLDLGDPDWQVVEVSPSGWRVLPGHQAPVRFRRPRGLQGLPVPTRTGSIEDLRPFVNLTEEDWILAKAYLAGMLRPAGPHPVLALFGEHGSAKSTTARVLRRTIDPNKADLRDPPRDTRDLMIAATNGYVVAFDNLSSVRAGLSDSLARLSTGAGFATRTLYEDDDETIFAACRPVLLNGIEDVVTRPDLLDRSIILYPPRIDPSGRRDEEEFWRAFDEVLPGVLGSLLDAAAGALRDLPNVILLEKPRMADFALWSSAAEPYLGLQPGEFSRAYELNRRGASGLALEASPVASAVIRYVEGVSEWSGTAGELATAIAQAEENHGQLPRDWPRSGPQMAGALKRCASVLRSAGLTVEYDERARPRQWTLRQEWETTDGSDQLTPDSRVSENSDGHSVSHVTLLPHSSDEHRDLAWVNSARES